MSSNRTRTSIANMAADALSATIIGDIEEGLGDALIYQRNYVEAVEKVLAEFPWMDAKARAILQPVSLVGKPPQSASGYVNAYGYPEDCLRPVSINDRPCEEIYWEVETIALTDQFGKVLSRRKVIYCDFEAPLSFKYVAFIEPGSMSAHLAHACALELALRCEGQITNSTSRAEKLRRDYKDVTKGSENRVGGYQIASRSQNVKPQVRLPTAGQRARAGQGL